MKKKKRKFRNDKKRLLCRSDSDVSIWYSHASKMQSSCCFFSRSLYLFFVELLGKKYRSSQYSWIWIFYRSKSIFGCPKMELISFDHTTWFDENLQSIINIKKAFEDIAISFSYLQFEKFVSKQSKGSSQYLRHNEFLINIQYLITVSIRLYAPIFMVSYDSLCVC